MRILALITARGGSKRLPGKNIKLLGGIPLIAWTIRTARESGCCTDILVSTDDQGIADVAQEHGASVPWLRPAELATDTATSVDVAVHAVNAYETSHGSVDGVLLLQPTSPFRTPESIRLAVAIFGDGDFSHPVVSVSPATCHPAWCFRRKGEGIEPFMGWEALGQRSQDLEPAWMLNGSIYITSPARLRAERTFVAPDARPLIVESVYESIDIDTAADFEQCEETLCNARNSA